MEVPLPDRCRMVTFQYSIFKGKLSGGKLPSFFKEGKAAADGRDRGGLMGMIERKLSRTTPPSTLSRAPLLVPGGEFLYIGSKEPCQLNHLKVHVPILRQLAGPWRRILAAGLLSFALAGFRLAWGAPQVEDGISFLREADRLMNLGNQEKAAPLYDSTWKHFLASGDHKNALAARMGSLLAGVQRGYLPKLSAELGECLKDPVPGELLF